MVTTNIEYLNFTAGKAAREYHLRVRRGEEARDVTVLIPNEAFLSGRVRYQDAPDVCFLKIQKELTEGGEGSALARTLHMSDQELEEYKVSHTPKTPGRRF
jgi:hypothetical protein